VEETGLNILCGRFANAYFERLAAYLAPSVPDRLGFVP
jgi:hypothetical protein